MGNFHIELLKYEKDHNTGDFLGQIYSTLLIPDITPYLNHLIGNIFSTNISENTISGNIVTSISDHLRIH